jgi:hypothetical protein
MPGKKFVQPLRQRKKNRASKQQSASSLEKNSCTGYMHKKNPAERRDEKKIVPQKFYTPPSRDF